MHELQFRISGSKFACTHRLSRAATRHRPIQQRHDLPSRRSDSCVPRRRQTAIRLVDAMNFVLATALLLGRPAHPLVLSVLPSSTTTISQYLIRLSLSRSQYLRDVSRSVVGRNDYANTRHLTPLHSSTTTSSSPFCSLLFASRNRERAIGCSNANCRKRHSAEKICDHLPQPCVQHAHQTKVRH